MSAQTFDAFTVRSAALLSRRASLVGFGGAALGAAAMSPATARAGKVAKKVKKKCKKQIGQCESSATAFCAQQFFDLEDCEATLLACCSSFKGCKGGNAYDCIVDGMVALASPPSPN